MEVTEIADKLVEFEEREEKEDGFRRRVALLISILAMLLAITAAGANKISKELLTTAIGASDTWAFYQAKTIRQTATLLAADQMESLLAISGGNLSDDAKKTLTDKLTRYRDTAKRYDSEADGTGKKELQEKALHFEHERDLAAQREPYFAFAEALLQIAIVMASAAVATGARFLVKGAVAVGAVGTLLAVDGLLLVVALPI